MASGFHLAIAPYDDENESLGGAFFGGREAFKAVPKRFADGYLALVIKPGTYVIQQFSRQDRWALCYNGKSVRFSVKPGQVLFLGEFDSVGSLAELEYNVVSTGQTSTRHRVVHFFDDITPPRFKPIEGSALLEAQNIATRYMTQTTSKVEAVQFSEAKFGTGNDLFVITRVCGGYYSGSPRKAE